LLWIRWLALKLASLQRLYYRYMRGQAFPAETLEDCRNGPIA
jgi:hypothetical protein